MRFAYADPPYLGLAAKLYGDRHPDAADYDRIETHKALVDRLVAEFPDGWALSLHSPALKHILPLCPDDVRVGAWCKPFSSFKPGVGVAYCWEPVVFRGGRKRDHRERTVRDYCMVNIALRRGFPGAKPEGFCHWMFEVLGAEAGDEMHDLFPGSGAVGRAWVTFRDTDRAWQPRKRDATAPLFRADGDAT